MTEESKSNSDQRLPLDSSATGGASPSSPSSRTTYGDPMRRPIGDDVEDQASTDDHSKHAEASDRAATLRREGRSQAEGGEGHAGPNVDATHVDVGRPSNRTQSALRPSSLHTGANGESEGACSSSSDETKAMPDEKPSDAGHKD